MREKKTMIFVFSNLLIYFFFFFFFLAFIYEKYVRKKIYSILEILIYKLIFTVKKNINSFINKPYPWII